MKKLFSIFLVVSLVITLIPGLSNAQEKEQYYWIASVSTIPLFLFHDYPTLKQEADRVGAEIYFQGPTNIDIEMQNNILEQVMATKPAGVLFMPFGEGHTRIQIGFHRKCGSTPLSPTHPSSPTKNHSLLQRPRRGYGPLRHILHHWFPRPPRRLHN